MNFILVSYTLDFCLQDQYLNYDTYIYRKSEHQWSKKANYRKWSLGKEIGINTLKHIIMHGNVGNFFAGWTNCGSVKKEGRVEKIVLVGGISKALWEKHREEPSGVVIIYDIASDTWTRG